jgi:hypothetical protein
VVEGNEGRREEDKREAKEKREKKEAVTIGLNFSTSRLCSISTAAERM